MNGLKIHTTQTDGYEIITAFSNATVDPVATQAAVKPMISEHGQVPVIEAKKRLTNDLQQKIGVINRKSTILWHDPETYKRKTVLTVDEKKAMDQYEAEWKTANVDIATISDELIVLNNEVRESEKQLLRDNPVFFECNADEYLLDEEETSELMGKFIAKSDTEQVTIEGETVEDYRGKLFHFLVDEKWGKRTIVTLGEFPGDTEILDADLSEEQRAEINAQQEQERIDALSTEDKQLEIDTAIDSAAGQAALMKSKLEIQGDVDALVKSQEFYQSEVSAINLKYGVV